MLYALHENKRCQASPKQKGTCPLCSNPVIAKCGNINAWHWSHKSNNCDKFSEGETLWHIEWKRRFAEKHREVIIEKHGKKHIADICVDGKVLELQNSPIAMADIYNREVFYNNMAWLFNGINMLKNFDLRKRDGHYSFRWKHPRKTMWHCFKPVFIDFGFCDFLTDNFFSDPLYDCYEMDYEPFRNKIFEIKKVHHNIPCGGWGVFLDYRDIIKTYGDKPDVRTIRKEVENA